MFPQVSKLQSDTRDQTQPVNNVAKKTSFFYCFSKYILAYFIKMKVGLPNYQSVCLSVCVSPTNNF
jgi:hypothetical protein